MQNSITDRPIYSTSSHSLMTHAHLVQVGCTIKNQCIVCCVLHISIISKYLQVCSCLPFTWQIKLENSNSQLLFFSSWLKLQILLKCQLLGKKSLKLSFSFFLDSFYRSSMCQTLILHCFSEMLSIRFIDTILCTTCL